MGAQFSQKQENAADDYAFDFCLQQNVDPYAMSKALNKLVELSNAGGEKATRIQKMFSSPSRKRGESSPFERKSRQPAKEIKFPA